MNKIDIYLSSGDYTFAQREFGEYHGITAAIITLNEEKNIVDFLTHIRPFVKKIVLVDGGSVDRTVELAAPLVDVLRIMPFEAHFANQKNNVLKLCHTDWVLFLDPDERMSEHLCNKLNDLINQDDYDCYKFPRREFIDGEEIADVYPDYQVRLFRSYCRFIRPVHEELVGYKTAKNIDQDSSLDLNHIKEKERHNNRNSMYAFITMHYSHETGGPSTQLENTIEKPWLDSLTKMKEKKEDDE